MEKGRAERIVCYLLYIINNSGNIDFQELSKVFSRSYSSVVHDLKLLRKYKFIKVNKNLKLEFDYNSVFKDYFSKSMK